MPERLGDTEDSADIDRRETETADHTDALSFLRKIPVGLSLLPAREFAEYFMKIYGAEILDKPIEIELNGEHFTFAAMHTRDMHLYFGWQTDNPLHGVVLKLLHEYSTQAEIRFLRERFFLEKRGADECNYWPQLLDEGKCQNPRRSFQQVDYALLELIEGVPLETFIDRDRGRRPIIFTNHDAFIAAVAMQIAHALEQAHDEDIGIRDLKPDHVILIYPQSGKPFIKLLDPGIIRFADSSLTSPGVIIGSTGYIAPEQLKGGAFDLRCDFYSLGHIMYNLLTGKSLFIDGPEIYKLDQLEIHKRHVYDPLPPLPPSTLSPLITQLLAKRPEDRPPDARAIREALKPFVENDPIADFIGPALGKAV